MSEHEEPTLFEAEESQETTPQDAYYQALSAEADQIEELGATHRQLRELQELEEKQRHVWDRMKTERMQAEQELIPYWQETLQGRNLLFSGEPSKVRDENGKWHDVDSTATFDSAIGTCIKVLASGEPIELNSRAQKLVERIKNPSVWMRVEDEDYLVPFNRFQPERVLEGEEAVLEQRLNDVEELRGSGLYAIRDIHIDPRNIPGMLEQWSDERAMPKSFVLKKGTILSIDKVRVNDDEPGETILEFEPLEGGKAMGGLRPQNTNARIKLRAIIDSIDDWGLIDDLELIVQ